MLYVGMEKLALKTWAAHTKLDWYVAQTDPRNLAKIFQKNIFIWYDIHSYNKEIK